jgi:hypothetical protein
LRALEKFLKIGPMLDVEGKGAGRFCDGLSRRDFLTVGALGMGGLSLPQLLQAEKAAGLRNSNKAIIMIYMAGAPPHQDLIDPKPDAPKEVRSAFGPIVTKVKGIHINESLPMMAKVMDKWTGIRSLVGAPSGSHDSFMCYTGRPGSAFFDRPYPKPPGNWPSIGSNVSKLMRSRTPGMPAFVGLAPMAGHPPYGSPGEAGFLGASHGPFRPSGPAREDMDPKPVGSVRLDRRQSLLSGFDAFRRKLDRGNELETMDAFTQQAFGVLTSSQLGDALDLDKEDPRIRERYGKGDPKNVGDGAPRNNEHFLLARRLVEAGARVVTLNFGRWDFHSNNTGGVNGHAPIFDRGLSALIEDLHQRGMADDVAVVAWGEFGRTPVLNKDGGRDHWPQVGCAFVAGGGMNHGQMIGSTDAKAAEPTERPVHFGEVHATFYQHLGINPHATTVKDLSGRPHYLVDGWKSLPELVG